MRDSIQGNADDDYASDASVEYVFVFNSNDECSSHSNCHNQPNENTRDEKQDGDIRAYQSSDSAGASTREGVVARKTRQRKRGYIYNPKPIVERKKQEPDGDLKLQFASARERNNEFARRSRKRRRDMEIELLESLRKMEEEKRALRLTIEELEIKNRYLESLLMKRR